MFAFYWYTITCFCAVYNNTQNAFIKDSLSSFGLGLLNDIYRKYGPDSFIGILSSVIQGSSDTTIYIITLYYGTVGIKKIRHSLWVGLLCDMFMVITSVIILTLFYS